MTELNTDTLHKLMGFDHDETIMFKKRNRTVNWEKVILRIKSHPDEASSQYKGPPPLLTALTIEDNPIPPSLISAFLENDPHHLDRWFHIVADIMCTNPHLSCEALRVLLDAAPKQTVINQVRTSFLTKALRLENYNVIVVLIEYFPWMLCHKSRTLTTPLHYGSCCSPDILHYLLQEGAKHNVGGKDGLGGLLCEDKFGITPLDKVIAGIKKNSWTDNIIDDENWNRLKVCLEFINNVKINSQDSLIHASIGLLPLSLVEFLMNQSKGTEISTDPCGVTILGKAILTASVADTAPVQYTSWRQTISFILSREKMNSNFYAKIRDGYGHPMLHFAAENGLKWQDGMEEILASSHDMLEVPDTSTGLYPFILAAAGKRSELSVIHRMLLLNPGLCR
jgi:hypothetical protein